MTGRTRALRAWLASPLFARQAIDFGWLWLVLKAGNALAARRAGLAPLGFRPGAELAAFAFESVALFVFVRRAREDVLLANLGVDRATWLLPFAGLHLVLSGAAALW